LLVGAFEVNLKDRLNSININFDDLQSGVDAGSREAESIHATANNLGQVVNGLRREDLVASLSRHAKELRQCIRDQRGALQELRGGLSKLREELAGLTTVRPPPASAADRRRR
jgi:ABC-type transporter Mla subunit MlaD